MRKVCETHPESSGSSSQVFTNLMDEGTAVNWWKNDGGCSNEEEQKQGRVVHKEMRQREKPQDPNSRRRFFRRHKL